MSYYFENDSSNATKWHSCRRDLELDFYSYLDSILSTQNSTYNDQILDFDVTTVSIKGNDPHRVKRLLDRLNENLHLDKGAKLQISKGLFCWQLQFTDINTVEYIRQFIEKHFELSKTALASFKITSQLKSPLSFSILSKCVNMVKLLVDIYDCELNNVYENRMNDVHYSIQTNQVIILKYLLEKHATILKCKEYSIMTDKQVLSPLNVAVHINSLECIKLILEFYLYNTKNIFEFIHSQQLIQTSECVNCIVAKEPSSKELKVKLLKTLFFKCKLSITSKYGVQIDNGLAQTIFSTYCTNENMFLLSYIFDILKFETRNQTDLYVIDTIIFKLEQSFEMNKLTIEELLKLVNNRLFLTKRLLAYKNGDLLSVKDNHLQANVTYHGISSNLYFEREKIFSNYGLLTEKACLTRLTDFIVHWLRHCSNRSSFLSASSTKRYLNSKQLIDLVESHLLFLKNSGFILLNHKNFIEWRIDLNNRLEEHLEIKSQFDYMIKTFCLKCEQQSLFTLKLLCRNVIRQSIRSLSDENVKSLELGQSLSDYLLNKIHI